MGGRLDFRYLSDMSLEEMLATRIQRASRNDHPLLWPSPQTLPERPTHPGAWPNG